MHTENWLEKSQMTNIFVVVRMCLWFFYLSLCFTHYKISNCSLHFMFVSIKAFFHFKLKKFTFITCNPYNFLYRSSRVSHDVICLKVQIEFLCILIAYFSGDIALILDGTSISNSLTYCREVKFVVVIARMEMEMIYTSRLVS